MWKHDEEVNIWKALAVEYFEVQSWNLPAASEEYSADSRDRMYDNPA